MGQLNELIRQASADRTPLIQLADRVGGVFVWVVLAIALGTAISWWMISGWQIALEHTIALLTIACPCALALAAPLVITVALGRAAREGIWIRDGNSLERLANPGTIWFDKTGTLTTGDLRVIGWQGPKWVLPGVFAIESQSDHPVARALCAYLQPLVARESQIAVSASQVEQIYGLGVQGIVSGDERTNRFVLRGDRCELSNASESKTVGTGGEDAVGEYSAQMRVQVEVDGEPVGAFVLGDALRTGVVETLVKLQRMGWEVGLLSGDSVDRVHAFAELMRRKGVNWREVAGGVSPEEKLQRIARPDARLRVMVGDGVNDAAALASADVGIAVRGPSEISLRNAPIYIGEDPLGSLLRLIDASKRTVWGIYRCFAASLIYNMITISLAASGLIHPLLAAVFMPISGITVLIMAWSAKTFPPNTKKG
jgi:Cu2+-exporting ATPase